MIALFCLAAICCRAQPAQSADLSLAVELQPALPLQPGTTATLTLRFTNAGPDDLPAVGAGSSAYTFLDFEVISLVPAPPAICQMYYDDLVGPPGQPSYLVATVFVGPIKAGETKTCTVALKVVPTASHPLSLKFYATDGQVFVDDPDRSNNRVGLFLDFRGYQARTIKVPVGSTAALWLLIVACGCSASARITFNKIAVEARRAFTGPWSR